MNAANLLFRPVQDTADVTVWNAFVRQETTLGPFYAWSWVEYVAVRAADTGGQNLSFLVMKDGRCIGVVPLVLQYTPQGLFFQSQSEGGFKTVFFGPALSSSLGTHERARLLGFVFAEIDRLARTHAVRAAYMSIDPYHSLSGEAYNWLCRYGYLDASISTHVIELQRDLELLKAARRKSYKPLINKGLRTFEFCVVDAAHFEQALFHAYVELHEKASGRKTRSLATFERQKAAIRRGEALLIAALYRGRPVHLVYFNALNGYAYYSSSAPDPDFSLPNVPTAPAILWFAVEHLRAAGYRYLETGWQPWGNLLFDLPDQKQRDTAFFKEGFGGRNVPLFRGVKYYDVAYMRRDLQTKLDALIEQVVGEMEKAT